MVAPFSLAAAAVLLALGPCFRLAVEVEVRVEQSAASQRTVRVETTDLAAASVRSALPQAPDPNCALVVLGAGEFQSEAPPAPAPSGRDARKDAVRGVWSSVRRVAAGDRATDLSLHRRGKAPGASNEARVLLEDFVLFRRIRYHESIRDSATPESMGAAAERVASQLSEIAARAAADLFSGSYDARPLLEYLRGPGRHALARLIVTVIDANDDVASSSETIALAFAREGIDLDGEALRRLLSGNPKNDDAARLQADLRAGISRRVASLLRRPGATAENPGTPVLAAEIDALASGTATAEAFARASESVFGASGKGLESAFADAGSDLFGSFGGSAFDPDLGATTIRWRTRVHLPGMLLRTSGTPLLDGSVLWLSLSKDLAQRATPLTAESLLLDDRAIASLGGTSSGTGPADLLLVLQSLSHGRELRPDPRLLETLREAVAGNAEARARVRDGADFEAAREVFGLKP